MAKAKRNPSIMCYLLTATISQLNGNVKLIVNFNEYSGTAEVKLNTDNNHIVRRSDPRSPMIGN